MIRDDEVRLLRTDYGDEPMDWPTPPRVDSIPSHPGSLLDDVKRTNEAIEWYETRAAQLELLHACACYELERERRRRSLLITRAREVLR